jgi:hypothetical protein
MIRPDSSTLELVVEAANDPLLVLQVCQGKLLAARDTARMGFDEYHAAEQIQEIRAILGAVADAMRAHALSPPWPRPGRKAVNAAVKAYEQDASVAPAEPDAGTSPAWNAL